VSEVSEIDKLKERAIANSITHMHIDWTEDGLKLSPEEKAKVLNEIDDHMSIPANSIAGRLRGRAFLLRDSAMCIRGKFDCRTLESIPPTKQDEARARDFSRQASLLEEAADFILGMGK